jgi:hypothetical protein
MGLQLALAVDQLAVNKGEGEYFTLSTGSQPHHLSVFFIRRSAKHCFVYSLAFIRVTINIPFPFSGLKQTNYQSHHPLKINTTIDNNQW